MWGGVHISGTDFETDVSWCFNSLSFCCEEVGEHIQNVFSKCKQMYLKTQSAVHDIVSVMAFWLDKSFVVCSGKDKDEKHEFAHWG